MEIMSVCQSDRVLLKISARSEVVRSLEEQERCESYTYNILYIIYWKFLNNIFFANEYIYEKRYFYTLYLPYKKAYDLVDRGTFIDIFWVCQVDLKWS